MEGPHKGEGSIAGNQSGASSKGRRRLERERRKEQQHIQEGHDTKVDFDEGSSQGERTVLYIPEHPHRSDRLRELENLRKQVNDMEIELRGLVR